MKLDQVIELRMTKRPEGTDVSYTIRKPNGTTYILSEAELKTKETIKLLGNRFICQ